MGVDLNFELSPEEEGGGLAKLNKREQGETGGSKFWSFCDNVLIECRPTTISYFPLPHSKCGS